MSHTLLVLPLCIHHGIAAELGRDGPIAPFFSGVMGMVSTLTTTIVGDDLLVLGVVAVPLVGISVGLLSRLFRQRV